MARKATPKDKSQTPGNSEPSAEYKELMEILARPRSRPVGVEQVSIGGIGVYECTLDGSRILFPQNLNDLLTWLEDKHSILLNPFMDEQRLQWGRIGIEHGYRFLQFFTGRHTRRPELSNEEWAIESALLELMALVRGLIGTAKGKPGRKRESEPLARFAIQERAKGRVYKQIAADWNRLHPPKGKERAKSESSVRSAVRRHEKRQAEILNKNRSN